MRRWTRRGLAGAIVLATAIVAHAVGNGDVRVNPEVTTVTIAAATGGGNGTATLQNTTPATTYNVLVDEDASCDPAMTFTVVGGNPIAIPPLSTRLVSISCPSRGTHAMRRCLYHA